MLDTNRPRLKVSRAGIVLIKSFESFRPRAVQRDDGRWVIGYGHTASAREGLTVGEADAELLLQYDLLPVVKALNEQVEAELNAHQFDALASFAVSVGVDRFLASDVLKRLNEGQAGQAADALIGWPETLAADAALRRRAAERALFVADPSAPVTLSDLLAAPLPPPPVETPVEAPAEAVVEEPAPVIIPNLSRAAAVATLLGEPHEPETVEAEPAVVAETAEPIVVAPEAEPVVAPEVESTPEPAPEPVDEATPEPESAPAPSPLVAAQLQRYSAYAVSMAGPLPGFPSAEPEPEAQPEPEAPASAQTEAAEVEAPVALVPPPVQIPVFTTAADAPPPLFVSAPAPSPFPPLELTPAVEADFQEPGREVWAPEQRAGDEADATETVLFDDDLPLSVLRHEVEPATPRRFDWIETGPYMIMGGLGLFACAASAAAFRKAMTDQSPLNDFTMIAWVLALIAAVCVGVSAWNLYRKAAKRDGDAG
ncbi:glycoside hydrolase family protein [Brevundimonas sp. GCM10030266]|uniref:lysozyme n=1 Tax=Brevundimonas sp. GCM10030266 TaxID=3273386 RepID=UPI003620740F